MAGRARFWLVAALGLALCANGARGQAYFNTGGGQFAARVTSLRDMPFRTVVRQQYDYSCGSAALATLLRHHYGRAVTEAQVFEAMFALGDQAKIRKVGFSLLDMKTYLSSVGLPGDGYRETLDDLKHSTAPAIAVIRVGEYRHFVVVKGVEGGRVLIGDPAQGLKSYSLEDFSKVWNGVVFVIHEKAASGAFNQGVEWASINHGRTDALDNSTLAGLTRDLPPLYQITAIRVAGVAP
jgi:predicted double-glycine peptidase